MSWVGWKPHTRCTTASAPRKAATSCSWQSVARSATCHSTSSHTGVPAGGGRRTTPTTSCPWSCRARTTADPTFPVAPVIATRTMPSGTRGGSGSSLRLPELDAVALRVGHPAEPADAGHVLGLVRDLRPGGAQLREHRIQVADPEVQHRLLVAGAEV